MITYRLMDRRRTIALAAGAVITVGSFVLAMWLIVFGGYYPGDALLVYVSVAVGPVAAAAAMLGFAVWWLVLFILSFFSPDA
jgi:hypothetical protein